MLVSGRLLALGLWFLRFLLLRFGCGLFAFGRALLGFRGLAGRGGFRLRALRSLRCFGRRLLTLGRSRLGFLRRLFGVAHVFTSFSRRTSQGSWRRPPGSHPNAGGSLCALRALSYSLRMRMSTGAVARGAGVHTRRR